MSLAETDETLSLEQVSRDSRVSVSVSVSYKEFQESQSQSRSRLRATQSLSLSLGHEYLSTKVSVSVSNYKNLVSSVYGAVLSHFGLILRYSVKSLCSKSLKKVSSLVRLSGLSLSLGLVIRVSKVSVSVSVSSKGIP